MIRGRNLRKQFKLFREGDKDADSYFKNRYYHRIYYFLLQKVGTSGLADKLTHRDFQLLYANRSRIPTVDHLLGFLYHTARECGRLHEMGRSCTDDGNFELPDSSDMLAVRYEPEVIENEVKVRVGFYRYVQTLRPVPKGVIEMRFLLHMDVATIATELGISPKTVKRYITRTNQWLRNKGMISG